MMDWTTCLDACDSARLEAMGDLRHLSGDEDGKKMKIGDDLSDSE